MRRKIHDVIAQFPQMTIAETLGALEFVKADMFEALRNSGPETDINPRPL